MHVLRALVPTLIYLDAAVHLLVFAIRGMAAQMLVCFVLFVLLVPITRRMQAMMDVRRVMQMDAIARRPPLQALVTRDIPAMTVV